MKVLKEILQNECRRVITRPLRTFLGDYIGADVYSNGEQEIQILGFPKVIENSMVFITLGVSKYYDMINNQCEIALAVDESYDECAEVLANAVFYILSNRMNFGKGILIEGVENINASFAEKYNKTALYFTNVFVLPENFAFVNDVCCIYMCLFVSKDEAEFIKKYGSEKFEDLLENSDVDVIDLKRKSVL